MGVPHQALLWPAIFVSLYLDCLLDGLPLLLTFETAVLVDSLYPLCCRVRYYTAQPLRYYAAVTNDGISHPLYFVVVCKAGRRSIERIIVRIHTTPPRRPPPQPCRLIHESRRGAVFSCATPAHTNSHTPSYTLFYTTLRRPLLLYLDCLLGCLLLLLAFDQPVFENSLAPTGLPSGPSRERGQREKTTSYCIVWAVYKHAVFRYTLIDRTRYKLPFCSTP